MRRRGGKGAAPLGAAAKVTFPQVLGDFCPSELSLPVPLPSGELQERVTVQGLTSLVCPQLRCRHRGVSDSWLDTAVSIDRGLSEAVPMSLQAGEECVSQMDPGSGWGAIWVSHWGEWV